MFGSNKYYNVLNAIESDPINDGIEKFQKNWVVVYFIDETLTIDQYHFMQTTIEFIKKTQNICKIYIYTKIINDEIQKIITDNDLIKINLMQLKSTKLFIVKDFLDKKHDIIVLDGITGFIINETGFKYPEKNDGIYADFTKINFGSNNISSELGKKYGFNSIINSKVMVIPYSESKRDFITDSYQIAIKLKTTNEEFITNISLTLTNLKYHIIKNFNSLDNILIFCYSKQVNKILSCLAKEIMVDYNVYSDKNLKQLSLKNSSLTFPFSDIHSIFAAPPKYIIPYNHSDYLYYPFLDIDVPSRKQFIDGTNIFNTNGFSPIIGKENPNTLLFKRFNKGDCGIFFKKTDTEKNIIPKILHHVWIRNEPISNYTNSWKRILRSPWKYMVWTEKEISKIDKWGDLFVKEMNTILKLLIANFAILSQYGGIVIDSFTIPLQIIPEDLLKNKFFISFFNEFSQGTKLSYRNMGSCLNNSLIDVLYKYFVMNGNNPEQIDKIIMSHDGTTVCPSYYFNPAISNIPKSLTDTTICINLWKNDYDEIKTKTKLKRNYKADPKAIIVKLRENPRNLLKNDNKNLSLL